MNSDALDAKLDEAERKAWEALARYKFLMFGYWAAVWVHLNSLGPGRRNPFRTLVSWARNEFMAESRRERWAISVDMSNGGAPDKSPAAQ